MASGAHRSLGTKPRDVIAKQVDVLIGNTVAYQADQSVARADWTSVAAEIAGIRVLPKFQMGDVRNLIRDNCVGNRVSCFVCC